MTPSKLKLDASKTDLIVFWVLRFNNKISHVFLSILDSLVHPAEIVKNLGVLFNADFSFSAHI